MVEYLLIALFFLGVLYRPVRKAVGLVFVIFGIFFCLSIIGIIIGIPMIFVGGIMLFAGGTEK